MTSRSSEGLLNHHSRSYTFGLLLSRIFHPIFLNVLMFLIVGYHATESHLRGIAWAIGCILLMVVPTALFFNYRLRQGVYTDRDVSVRQQRTELYLFGLGNVVVVMALLLLFGLPRPLFALLTAALLVGVVGVVINMFWKISVHAGSIASTATVASLYVTEIGVALWVCALALGWARVRTGNHTLAQVVAGTVLSATIVLLVFRWMLFPAR